MTPILDDAQLDSLWQLFVCGPTWDGNLISKEGRNHLCKYGLARRFDGWSYLTDAGLRYSLSSGFGGYKEARRSQGLHSRLSYSS